MKNILFITHQSARTGAPLVLLHFLKWLREKEKEINIMVLSLKGGDLSQEFADISDIYYECTPKVSSKLNFLYKVKKNIFPKSINPYLNNILGKFEKNIDIIYANTIVSLPIASKIMEHKESKLVAHIHELNNVINLLLPNLETYNNIVTSWIAASDLVKDNLILNHNIPERKVNRIYEFSTLITPENKIKKSKFIVGGCGTVEWRKGYDLFIQLAIQISKKYEWEEIGFCWIGFIPEWEKSKIEYDLKKAGIDEIIFRGETLNPEIYINQFDVLAMTSREDPFPLVCIEAGMLGKPIICFKGATGTEEILKMGGGEIVPYLDIEELANQIIIYYENRNKLKMDGKKGKDLFSEFTPINQAPKIFNLLSSIN